MKKCSSCTKDLPDAALHCVFCGAKQPPAPATSNMSAKTVMGHGSEEMIQQLRAAQAATQARQAPSNLPAAAPYPQPQQPPAAPYPPPQQPFAQPQPAPYPAPPAAQPRPQPATQPVPPGPGMVPTAGSVAPTMFIPGGAPQLPPQAGPHGGTPAAPVAQVPAPVAPAPAPEARPSQPATPSAPPSSAPYIASRHSARPGRPIEPWKDSLRLLMLIWGGVLLIAFLTPQSTDPMVFHWDTIIDGKDTDKLMPLIIAATALLSILLALIPSSPPPRGLIAALLGLTGFGLPIVLDATKAPEFGTAQIILITAMVGVFLAVPGLLIRNEYRTSIAGRIMVTLGALCVLTLYLVPVNEKFGIVEAFDLLAAPDGKAKTAGVLLLIPVVLCAAAMLLAWLPAPSSGAGKVLAWLAITYPAVLLFTKLIVGGEIGDVVKASPYGALMSWAPMSAFLVLIGYGLATAIGKNLE